VLVDLAVMIADGGEAIGDIDVLRHQGEVFGSVASAATCWRALDEIDTVRLARIGKARAKVRARVWALLGGPPAARAAGREIGAGVVVLDMDSTIVIAHSDKEGASPSRHRGRDPLPVPQGPLAAQHTSSTASSRW